MVNHFRCYSSNWEKSLATTRTRIHAFKTISVLGAYIWFTFKTNDYQLRHNDSNFITSCDHGRITFMPSSDSFFSFSSSCDGKNNRYIYISRSARIVLHKQRHNTRMREEGGPRGSITRDLHHEERQSNANRFNLCTFSRLLYIIVARWEPVTLRFADITYTFADIRYCIVHTNLYIP